MKKMVNLLFLQVVFFAVLLSFSACNSSKKTDVVQPTVSAETTVSASATVNDKDAKITELEKKVSAMETKLNEKTTTQSGEVTKTVEKVEIKAYSGPNYITLNKPENEASFHEEPIVFTGVVSPNTAKITITAKSGDKACDTSGAVDGPCTPYNEDVYTLTDFHKGESSFIYRAKRGWKNLQEGTNDFSFKAYFDDGSDKSAVVKIYYTNGGAEMGKPVIYLYPNQKTEVSVNVRPTSGISISEPKIGDGWKVVASPDGTLLNLADGKIYPYLFWEGFAVNFKTPKEGFVIASKDVAKFFDTKLKVLGLNKKEIADFKEFWVPILSTKAYYFITFIPQTEFERYAPLTVSPKPDSVIRVFFDYRGLDKKISVEEQNLKTAERKGFAVIEWGGRLYR